jgi:hypothetical protein
LVDLDGLVQLGRQAPVHNGCGMWRTERFFHHRPAVSHGWCL